MSYQFFPDAKNVDQRDKEQQYRKAEAEALFLATPPQKRVKLVLFDWAGTAADPFCLAPYNAFDKTFSALGFSLTPEQITGPMGLNKIEHIRHLVYRDPLLSKLWLLRFKKAANEENVRFLYAKFMETLHLTIKEHTALTPFFLSAIAFLEKHRVPYGFTTGYPRSAWALSAKSHKDKLNYALTTTADEVKTGTRYDMLKANLLKAGLTEADMGEVVFFTDAKSDVESVIAEAKARGKPRPWIVGVAGFSTHVGLTSKQELDGLSPSALKAKQENAKEILFKSGANAVIEDMSQLSEMVARISEAIHLGKSAEETRFLDTKKVLEEAVHLPCATARL